MSAVSPRTEMELRHVRQEALDLALGRLRVLPARVIEQMAESLRTKGQLTPVVAAERDGRLVLIDGFVRCAASARMGLGELLVEVVELTDIEMKAQVYLRNRDRGLMLLEECRLIDELNRVDGLNQVEIGALIERHKSWVCRRLALYRGLSPRLRDEGVLQRLGSGSIRRLALLPHRNQEELVDVIEADELSPRNAAILLELWRRATEPDARAYLLAHPREAIRLSQDGGAAAAADPRLGDTGQYVVDGLSVVEQVSLRVSRRLRKAEDLPPEGVQAVSLALDRARSHWEASTESVRLWLSRTAVGGDV